MKTKLLTAIAMVAILLTFVSIVSAGTQGSCSSGDATKVILRENALWDTSDGNDHLWICSGTLNLADVAHTLPGDCHTNGLPSITWNDCVSAVAGAYVPQGWALCLYGQSGYSGTYVRQGPTGSTPDAFNMPWEGMSSLRWVTSGTPCN